MPPSRSNRTGPLASIILLVYNGEFYLQEVLTSIFNQKTSFEFEVIAIDSGSGDGSLEILSRFPVKLHRIPNSDFGHGRTRNLGARLASGDYVIFLTQDATPVNELWLENLLEKMLEDARIAGSFSRQIPRPDCNPMEMRDIAVGAPPVSSIKKINFKDSLQKKIYQENLTQFIVFSDVSSCIRKSYLEQMPFNENIVMMEDQEWCKRAIEAGHIVIYEASSLVYHSHNHTVPMVYKRNFDYGKSLSRFIGLKIRFTNVILHGLYDSTLDFFFIMLQDKNIFWKMRYAAKAPFIRFAARYGLYKGFKS